MPGSFLEKDMKSLFKPSEFAVSGGVFWSNCPGTPINAIFDDEDVEVTVGEGITEIRPQAVITAIESDFAGIARDQTITINDVVFTIQFWRADGTGEIQIFLETT